MDGMFGPIKLKITRESVDLSRVQSASGISVLADHDGTRPIGIVTSAEIQGNALYMDAEWISTDRSEPYLQEARGGSRRGVSPGFLIRDAEFSTLPDGQILTLVTAFEVYECSLTPVPRSADAAILMWEGSPSEAASLPSPSARPAATAKTAVSAQRPAARHISTPTPTSQERNARMTQIETRVDEKLVDLSRRERELADVEAKPAAGDPQPLAETLLALCSLATNPSGPTPRMPGVEVTSARTNHLTGRIPSMSLSLTSSDAVGTEIGTVEVGDLQPQGRSARRLLGLCRQSSPRYGQQAFPILSSAPGAAMILEGSVLAMTDAAFANPAPVATPHLGVTRASYSLLSLIQGGAQFKEMVDQSLAVALQDLMAGQLVAGTGVAPSLTGLLHTADTESVAYLSTNRGAAAMFRSASDLLDDQTYGPEGRLAFLISTSLYREARQTLREPGDGNYVVADGLVLGETLALKNDDLGVNQAILFDASYVVFCIWDQMDVAIDQISSPGNVKITLSAQFDAVPLRPQSIIVVDQM